MPVQKKLGLNRIITTFPIIAITIMLYLGFVSYYSITLLVASQSNLNTSENISGDLDALQSSLKDTETGQRGYLITADDTYLIPYTAALTIIPTELQNLQSLLTDKSEIIDLNEVTITIGKKLSELNQTIILRRDKGFYAAQSIVLDNTGRDYMIQISEKLADIKSKNDATITKIQKTSATNIQTAFIVILSGITLGVIFILSSLLLLRHNDKLRNKAELSLQEEKAKDDAILENIGEGMIVTNLQGKIIIANRAAGELLHTSIDKLINKMWGIDIPILQDDQGIPIDYSQTVLRLALEQGILTSQSYNYKLPDGTTFPVIATGSPIIIQKQITGGIVIFRDVSKEKQVDRMKTEFISLASHQLRTPLSAIRWFTEMLINGDGGELTTEQMDFMHNVKQATINMIDLVNALLNVSRIESGRIIIEPKPTNLGELLDEVILENQQRINEKKQTLIKSVHENLPMITIDPKLIRQVYLNLLTNAIKYTPEGGEISIFISRKEGQIVSQISDNGYGIPENDKPKLFTKFFRAGNIVKIETDGTGLGLYLVKAIIESSKGKIWYNSEEGKGTSFYFSLPLSGTPAKQGEVTIT